MHKQENLKKRLLASAEQHLKMSLYSKDNTGLYKYTHTSTFSCGLKGSQSPHAVQLGHVSPKTTFCKWKHCPVPVHPFTKLKHYILWDSSGTWREALWWTWSRSLNDQLAGKWFLFLSQLTFILMSLTLFSGSLSKYNPLSATSWFNLLDKELKQYASHIKYDTNPTCMKTLNQRVNVIRKQIRPLIVIAELLLSVAFPVSSMLCWILSFNSKVVQKKKKKLHKWFRFTLTWPKICLCNFWCLNMNHKAETTGKCWL